MKTIFTTIGLLAVIILVSVWQYGFFNKQMNNAMKKLDRATAVQRAEKMIRDTQAKADGMNDRSRELKIEARSMEIGLERQQEDLAKSESAYKQMAAALKAAGLPKPSEMGTLTDEQKKTPIVFAGKSGTAADAYRQVAKWKAEYDQKKSVLDSKRKLVDARNKIANQMLDKQKEMYAYIEKIQTQLAQLDTQREVAEINKELAELGATVEGVNSGDLGKTLDTIQAEIDELNATTEVTNAEADKPTSGDTWSKDDVNNSGNPDTSLDALWD